jgi:hypothetical protein
MLALKQNNTQGRKLHTCHHEWELPTLHHEMQHNRDLQLKVIMIRKKVNDRIQEK